MKRRSRPVYVRFECPAKPDKISAIYVAVCYPDALPNQGIEATRDTRAGDFEQD